MTGGRIKKIKKYVGNERFMLTYGDGVSDININELEKYHEKSMGYLTMTAVRPGGRFGVLDIDEKTNSVNRFVEKSKEDGGWINGGFMVVEPEVFDLIEGNETIFEKRPLEDLAKQGRLNAYKHYGFWQCMDTQRDKVLLEKLWRTESAKWKVWN
jgi:glucose-1-phosphate cytidylyltransferase